MSDTNNKRVGIALPSTPLENNSPLVGAAAILAGTATRARSETSNTKKYFLKKKPTSSSPELNSANGSSTPTTPLGGESSLSSIPETTDSDSDDDISSPSSDHVNDNTNASNNNNNSSSIPQKISPGMSKANPPPPPPRSMKPPVSRFDADDTVDDNYDNNNNNNFGGSNRQRSTTGLPTATPTYARTSSGSTPYRPVIPDSPTFNNNNNNNNNGGDGDARRLSGEQQNNADCFDGRRESTGSFDEDSSSGPGTDPDQMGSPMVGDRGLAGRGDKENGGGSSGAAPSTPRAKYLTDNCAKNWRETLGRIKDQCKDKRENIIRNEPLWKQALVSRRIMAQRNKRP